MKIREVKPATKSKKGRLAQNGVKTETSEDQTILHFIQLGYDVEVIKPSNAEKIKNPDIVLFNTIWEMKNPETTNEKTIKKRFHKASKQSSKIIFDLRNVKRGHESVEKQIIKLFKGNNNVNRLIIIEKSGKTIDISK